LLIFENVNQSEAINYIPSYEDIHPSDNKKEEHKELPALAAKSGLTCRRKFNVQLVTKYLHFENILVGGLAHSADIWGIFTRFYS